MNYKFVLAAIIVSLMFSFTIVVADSEEFVAESADFTEGDYTYTVPDTKVTEVVIKKFNNSTMETVTIEDTVTHNAVEYDIIGIAADAFYGKTKIKAITITDNVKTIGSDAFKGCTALTEITFSSSLSSGSINYGITLKDYGGSKTYTSTSDILGHTFKGTEKDGFKRTTDTVIFHFKFPDGTRPLTRVTHVEVEHDTAVKEPTVKKYTTEGWYTSEDYKTKWNFNTKVTENTNLYAKFEGKKISTITVKNTGEDLVVVKGQSLKIQVAINPEDVLDSTLEYTSSNKSLADFDTAATKDNENVLKAIAAGKVEITIKAREGTAETKCTITVVSGDNHEIKIENDGHGTATASPAKAKYGQTVTLTSVPDKEYQFLRWESSDVEIKENKFTMPDKAVTIKVIFKEKDVPIVIEKVEHGKIIGKTEVEKRSNATYSFEADNDYLLSEVIVDGNVVAKDVPVYTLVNVVETHKISAKFVECKGATTDVDSKGNVTEKYITKLKDVQMKVEQTFNVDGSGSAKASYYDESVGVNMSAESKTDKEQKTTGTITCTLTIVDPKKLSENFSIAARSISGAAEFTHADQASMTIDAKSKDGKGNGFSISFNASDYDESYGIKIISDNLTLDIDKEAMTYIVDEDDDVEISAEKTTKDEMSERQAWIVQDYHVYDVDIAGVSSFDGVIKLIVPFTLPAEKEAKSVAMYYVSTFDAEKIGGKYESGYVTAELPHLSYYFAAADYKESDTSAPGGYNTIIVVLLILLIIILLLLCAGMVFFYDLDDSLLYLDARKIMFWRR